MATTKKIKLLLTETVDNLGIVGDVVDVRAGYARNFLLPHAMATKPTPGNIKRLEARRAQVQAELAEKRKKLEAIFAKLVNHEITLLRSANEQGQLFGSVTQADIVYALKEEGFTDIHESNIRIGSPIKHLDSYKIPIQLEKDLKTEIKVWVVSDKPSDQLKTEAAEETAGAEASATEIAVEETEAKPKKKSKKAAAEEAGAEPTEKAEPAEKSAADKKAEKAEKAEKFRKSKL